MGNSGTGKSTFLVFLYAWWLEIVENSMGMWLIQKSIKKHLENKIPEFYKKQTAIFDDPMDKRWCGGESNPYLDNPKLLLCDELSKIFDKYSNYDIATRRFGGLTTIHRPKDVFMIACDQEWDFIHKLKQTRHWFMFTGAADNLGKKLAEQSTFAVRKWFEYNTSKLIILGEFNRKSLRETGFGIVIMTNGMQTYKIPFRRMPFFDMDFSRIFRYIEPEEIIYGDDPSDDSITFERESPFYKTLMFSYHIAYAKYGEKVTKEKLSRIFRNAAKLFYDGTSKKLQNARFNIEIAKTDCGTEDCPFCIDYDFYLKKLEEFDALIKPVTIEIPREIKDKQKELEGRIASHVK